MYPAIAVLGICISLAGNAVANEQITVLHTNDFERDSDGDGVADGWNRWNRSPGLGPTPTAEYRLETEGVNADNRAQRCQVTVPEAGVILSLPARTSVDIFRTSIWIKVTSGHVIVQGFGQHGGFGWHEMSTENAGEWTEIRKEYRLNRWRLDGGGVLAFSRNAGTNFLLDNFSGRKLESVQSTEPTELPDNLRSVVIGREKKLINACGSSPTIAYARDHVEEIELAPFDGTTLKLDYGFEDQFWGANKVEQPIVDRAIDDLKSTQFQKFTENFIWCNTVPGARRGTPGFHGDWFDDAIWNTICHNARMVARVCKNGELKGIFFDTEHYHGRVFDYQAQHQKDEKSYIEFASKARERGRQFIQAMNAEYPEIVLLILMTGAFAADDMWHAPSLSIERCEYGLFPPFLDGMIDAAASRTRFIDGFARAYNFTRYNQFVQARKVMTRDAAKLSASPQRYEAQIEVGFGVPLAWRSPREAEDAIHYALLAADQYVWIWSHGRDFKWQIGWADKERVAVMQNCRLPRDSTERISVDDLPAYWQVRDHHYYAGLMGNEGFEELKIERVGFVEGDAAPKHGQVDFSQNAESLSFDYNMRSLVLDLGASRPVTNIHLYGSLQYDGATRIDESNVQLLVSEDNVSYAPIECIYRELDRYTIELAEIHHAGRYYKVHCTVSDTNGSMFSTGTFWGGPKAFSRP